MNKFTYGYIREATMAHLDIDETEAQAMDLLKRFPIYANEAMQAICSSKPKYEYVDVNVVRKLAPLVLEGASFVLATPEQIKQREDYYKLPEEERPPLDTLPIFANDEQVKAYWHERNTYEVGEKVSMEAGFIAYANKRAYKYVHKKIRRIPEECNPQIDYNWVDNEFEGVHLVREEAKVDDDFSYISRAQLKFYRPGQYLIPAKFMWFIFESGISDEQEIDIPSDILTCIPLYIAAICLQIDNPSRAQIKRSEFEMALARCTSSDFMTNNRVKTTW